MTEIWRKTTLHLPESLHRDIQVIKREGIHSAEYWRLIERAVKSINNDEPRFKRIDSLINKLESSNTSSYNSYTEVKSLLIDVIHNLKSIHSDLNNINSSIEKLK